MKISNSFLHKIKAYEKPIYILALEVGFHPSRLSRIIGGEEVKRPHDIRFQLLANLVGFNGKLFQEIKNHKEEII